MPMFVCDWDFLHFGVGILVGVALTFIAIIAMALVENSMRERRDP